MLRTRMFTSGARQVMHTLSRHNNKVENGTGLLTLIRTCGYRTAAKPVGKLQWGKSRCFHTTQPNHIHPLLWFVVRPVAKLFAMVVGRGVRKWWTQLPQNKRALFLQALNRQKLKLFGFTVFMGGVGIVYYETHLQETPLLKRRRFIAFNSSQVLELADFQQRMLLEGLEGEPLLQCNPLHKRVQRVADQIVKANRDIREINERTWHVTVIDNPTQNAFVLPNGEIFVFQGMLDLFFNDDQLGIILGHEMAHAVLNHGAEQMSYLRLVDLFTIILVGAIWAVLPSDLVSALVQWMMHKFVHVLMELPYSRQLEIEADEIGLDLSAKACFDVRESPAFWARLDAEQKAEGNETRPDWLSTHPGHEARSTLLESKLLQAMSLRLACKCPPLPEEDPRERKIVLAQPIKGIATA